MYRVTRPVQGPRLLWVPDALAEMMCELCDVTDVSGPALTTMLKRLVIKS